MLERILWNNSRVGEQGSPFQNNNERPLRLTFHGSSFNNLSTQDQQALNAFQEFVRLEQIEAIGTDGSSLPNLEIVKPDHDKKDVQVRLKQPNSERGTAFPNFGQYKTLAATLSGQHNQETSEFQEALQDVLVARAHHALNFDIFVTCSPILLKNTSNTWLRDSNPRSPSDAVKILGLLLRSRGDFALRMIGTAKHSFDRGLFYWVLTRHRLPGMWNYFGTCLDAGKTRADDTDMMAQSVLVRTARAHEARDAVGRLFYLPQGNNTRDEIMYHFEYLTLLLAGAFDSLARIAHRTYKIKNPEEWSCYFHKVKYQEALAQKKATQLVGILTSQNFKNLSALLYELRNTIHGASLQTLAYSENAEPQKSYLEANSKQSEKLWSAADSFDSPNAWGLRRAHKRVLIEPFSFASKLLQESLKYINDIAEATDLTGLFPGGHVMRNCPPPPADDNIFGNHIGARLDLLA